MRKLFTSFLTLALASSISAAAFATTTNSDTNTGSGSTNINVSGVYKPASTTIISVDITWDNMEFTFLDEGSWNPTNHTSSGKATWSWDGATEEQSAPKITVTNHSNTDVKVSFNFSSDVEGLVGSFNRVDAQNSFYIPSAANKSPENAPDDFTNFSITDGKINHDYDADYNALGTITVTVSSYNLP